MTKQIGDLKLHFSKRGIAFKWKDGEIKRLSFGGSGGEAEAGDGYGQGGYQDDDRYDAASYAQDSYGQDGYFQGEYDNYGNREYDAERAQSGDYEDSQAGYGDRFDFLYHNDIIMWAALVLLPPLGIWILWKRQKFDQVIRAAISAAAAIWFILMLVWLFSKLFAGGGVDPTISGSVNPGGVTPSGLTDTIDGTKFNGGSVDNTIDATGTGADATGITPSNPSGGTTGGTGNAGTGGTSGTTAEDPDVYTTASDVYYHKVATCSKITGTPSTLKQSVAESKNKTKCPDCWTDGGTGTGDAAGTGTNATKKVWATANGKYYHTIATCSGMKNASQVTLAQAQKDGKTKCPVCTIAYYYTANGTYYHSKANCSGMTNAKKATLAQAKAAGKKACPVCVTKKATTLAAATTTAKKTTAAGTTYYATSQGKYYHTKSNCSGMKGATKITLANAKKAGKTACPVCVAKKTTTGGATYYSTIGGKYYHAKSTCSGMKGATKVTLATAKKRGQTACPVCIAQVKSSAGNDSKAIYYATSAGKYYHTKANCSGMTGAKKITLATALKYGKKPCPVCFKKAGTTTAKPTAKPNTNTYVYATANGKYYHSRSTCSGMTGAKRVTLAAAKKAGKTACPSCMKRAYYYASSSNRYYHKTASCPGVRNATRITLASAKAKGKIACPVCVLKRAKAGDLKIGTYVVKGGKYYHKNKTCNGMKGAKKVSLAYAKGSGRTACPRCVLKKQSATASADKKVACYLLKKGTYYHSTKYCSMLLGKSGIVKTSVYKAKTHSFKACPECVGKKLKTYVYASPTGLYYHSKANCGGMKNAMKLTLQTAINRAYKRCTKCNAPKA